MFLIITLCGSIYVRLVDGNFATKKYHSFQNDICISLFYKKFEQIRYWWAGMDSNHRTRMRTDLQSAAFSHSATYPNIKLKNKWCALKDSNLGPTGYEPVALTN